MEELAAHRADLEAKSKEVTVTPTSATTTPSATMAKQVFARTGNEVNNARSDVLKELMMGSGLTQRWRDWRQDGWDGDADYGGLDKGAR